MALPKIAVIPTGGTIQNGQPLVTSAKAGGSLNVLRPQRLHEPVTVKISKEDLDGNPLPLGSNEESFWTATLQPEDGLYLLPPMEPDHSPPEGYATVHRDVNRIIKEINRFGLDTRGRNNLLAEQADLVVKQVVDPRTGKELRAGGNTFTMYELVLIANAALTAFPEWKGAKLVAALAQKTFWLLILRSDLGAAIGDVQAVKGLRIGAAPGPDVALRRLLAEAGIDLERDGVNIAPVPGASGPGVSFGVHAAQSLEEGTIDGFWANGMGSELAVRNGIGSVILDVRRGIGPSSAQHYTFPALVTTEANIAQEPESVAAAVRAIVNTQNALQGDHSIATTVGERLFPPAEAGLIAELIERDLPYYEPAISEEVVDGLNHFAQDIGLLSGPIPYDQVVPEQFRDEWLR